MDILFFCHARQWAPWTRQAADRRGGGRINPPSAATTLHSCAVPWCGKRWSRPVSRVLYVSRRDSHSSRPGVATWLQRPTREQRGPRYRSPIWSCSEWGLPCRTTLTPYAVRSYRTLSPLPDPLARPSAVCSLLHWPSAHAAQELPGTLPYGARTFLDALACDATVRPTPWRSVAR